MNVNTTDTLSSVHSRNTTTPGDRLLIQSHNCKPTLSHVICLNLWLFHRWENSAGKAGELFVDWIEQFELVASVCHWDDRTKLVNLTTRLRGQAFAFYRSCSTQQQNNYTILVSKLKKRFTPIRLQAVQSSLFHDRKQKSNESVDAYAQELRTLRLPSSTARNTGDRTNGLHHASKSVCCWIKARYQS